LKFGVRSSMRLRSLFDCRMLSRVGAGQIGAQAVSSVHQLHHAARYDRSRRGSGLPLLAGTAVGGKYPQWRTGFRASEGRFEHSAKCPEVMVTFGTVEDETEPLAWTHA
jgi:hypothetical protein